LAFSASIALRPHGLTGGGVTGARGISSPEAPPVTSLFGTPLTLTLTAAPATAAGSGAWFSSDEIRLLSNEASVDPLTALQGH